MDTSGQNSDEVESIADQTQLRAAQLSVSIKPNWREISAHTRDPRTDDRLAFHYNVERRLAQQLSRMNTAERLRGYSEIYSSLFASIPDHPQHLRKSNGGYNAESQAKTLRKLAPAGCVFVEIGAGDAHTSLAMCRHVGRAIALDVSDAVANDAAKPDHFAFVKIDGIHLPLETDSVDFVYSNQLMEHLHPDDAAAQLREIYRALTPAGAYYCVTPNALSGPHDVSKYFDDVPQGLHLKEYTYRELSALLKSVGFRRTRIVISKRFLHFTVPAAIGIAFEKLILALRGASAPRPLLNRFLRGLLGIRMVAIK